MELIKGIPVTLYERKPVGKDPFGAPIYKVSSVVVENVLVTPVAAEEVMGEQQMWGGRAEYELSIPKGDTNSWSGCRVEFFGSSWRVIGPPKEYIEELLPLQWNRKVRVERYG